MNEYLNKREIRRLKMEIAGKKKITGHTFIALEPKTLFQTAFLSILQKLFF